jgi:uncharacterized protein YyaL (SSP411 family)
MPSRQTLVRIALTWIVLISSSCGNKRQEAKEPLNHLAQSSSPYLIEHADNPVDWYEWGEEALTKAKKEGKPLIISVGYASCHWCHVMEEETFMDTAVARLMNENFVSIKVDREERPDVDQIYINAAQLTSGNAGWPLNAFALPDGRPFYVAAYFPKGQWKGLLNQILDVYRNDKSNLIRQAEAITKGIQTSDVINQPVDKQEIDNQKTYLDIFSHWQSSIDYHLGGLAGSPKFPMPVVWEFMLQNHYLTGNVKSLEAVNITLNEMAKGGIYDHLGGGFARYSTDTNWMVPHFEKMLYDNAQLVSLYSHAYQVNQNPNYRDVIQETLAFITVEFTSPEGGFYSSLDADSEGEEGKFYAWTKAEIENLLGKKSALLFLEFYNISDSGNWDAGKNILHKSLTNEEFAKKNTLNPIVLSDQISKSKMILLAHRNKRVHPTRDDKILTSWNALMLTGYLDAYLAINNETYLKTALSSARFLEKNMIRKNGQLWRGYKNGKAGIDAFLDDYVFLIRSYVKLYEATFDIHWLELARKMAEYTIQHFYDKTSGMFYYTSDESEQLVARKMELTDNVIPSSNSVMADALYRLGEYYDHDSYKELSKVMVNQISKNITKNGPYYANWANVMGMIAYQPYEVAVVGEEASKKSIALQNHYLPTAILMGGMTENLPLLENKLVIGKTIIYVCRDKVCKMPVQDVNVAMKQLHH